MPCRYMLPIDDVTPIHHFFWQFVMASKNITYYVFCRPVTIRTINCQSPVQANNVAKVHGHSAPTLMHQRHYSLDGLNLHGKIEHYGMVQLNFTSVFQGNRKFSTHQITLLPHFPQSWCFLPPPRFSLVDSCHSFPAAEGGRMHSAGRAQLPGDLRTHSVGKQVGQNIII